MKKNVCCIVVTYNRLALLQECISAVKAQSFSCDILVVNNNSTDDTENYLKEHNIWHITLDNNYGGAGGFNFGIKSAYDKEYEYFWLMDDDCIPKENALENLMLASDKLNNDFGFISSKVLWIDGNIHNMNQYPTNNKIDNSLHEVKQATFVSLLIKRSIVEKYGLPIKDFFIWGDDIEYTRRIAVRNNVKSYYASNSEVIHKTKKNMGSKIAFDDISNIDRYYYAYRNDFYLYRQEGISGLSYYFLKCIYNFIRILVYSPNKISRLKVLFSGISNGVYFNPEVEYIS